jgi:hypothetical protein
MTAARLELRGKCPTCAPDLFSERRPGIEHHDLAEVHEC